MLDSSSVGQLFYFFILMSQPPLYKPFANCECKMEGSKRVWSQ